MHDELSGKETLLELLEGLPDPRLDHNKRHRLVDILVIAICGALCGIDDYVELERFARVKHKWFESFLELPNGIASHDTIGRVLAMLDRKVFADVFVKWVSCWTSELGDGQIAIDGKALRATVERSKKGSVLTLVSGFAVEAGLALGQVQTQEGSNEIEAVPRLLQQLDLKGKHVSLDALHTQTSDGQDVARAGSVLRVASQGQPTGTAKKPRRPHAGCA